MMKLQIAFLGIYLTICCAAEKPNLILILTDDQDKLLDGMDAMPKTKALIGDTGVTMENFFVATPSCCVSRATIHSGMYAHNTQTFYNTYAGGCSGKHWLSHLEPNGLAPSLKNAGYQTFFMGKYLNQYGSVNAGGPEHIPAGWDSWFGLTSEDRYYDYTLSVNGVETVYGSTEDDYFTTQLAKEANTFIDANSESPMFMMLAATAPHGPSTPEEAKQSVYTTAKAPRGGAFGEPKTDRHWLIREAATEMPRSMENYIDRKYVARWQTLASVDDMVSDVITKLGEKGVLDNTYIIYTSDNGFHMGQFCMPIGKWQPYEWDIKVPFLMRGPGITAGSTITEPVVTVDIMPTLLSLGGATTSLTMDGQDISPLLFDTANEDWRTDFLIEYWGSAGDVPSDCPQYGDDNVGTCRPGCICQDAKNNTFSCVRTISDSENSVYCEFDDTEQYKEFYDLTSDENQLINLAVTDQFTAEDQASHATRLRELTSCAGADSCY